MASRSGMSDADAEMKSDTAERAQDSLRVGREPPDPTIKRAPMSPRVAEPHAAPPVPPQPQPDRMSDTMMRERVVRRPIVVRGGIAPGAILTGVLVSLGAMVIFMSIAAGLLAVTGVIGSGATDTTSI